MKISRNNPTLCTSIHSFKPVNVFDQSTIAKMYAEQNLDEWYDMLFRMSDVEIKKVCHYFHLEIILNSVIMKERYCDLLSEKFSKLN